MTPVRWVAASVGVLVLGLVGLLATRAPAQSTVAPSPLVGRAAPEVTGTSLDGRTVRLSQFRGRFVVLNFFASWCIPCQQEHDDLMRFNSRHASQGDAQVLAVIFSDDPSDARRFFTEHGGDWPVLHDPKGRVALDFGVRGPPESFLISPDGTVVSRIVGQVNDEALEKLLHE